MSSVIKPKQTPEPRRGELSMLGDSIAQVGACALFLLSILAAIPKSLRHLKETIRQIWFVGAMSLVIIMTCGLFVGMVLGLQLYYVLSIFGGTAALGTVVSLSLYRELGPVVTALLFAGRAGTSITAEIGLMRATDQIAAMEMMAVDPMRYVAAPRFLGGIIAMPLLVAIFDAVGLFGAQLVGVQQMGVNAGTFWSQTQGAVHLDDVTEGIIKSIAFGVTCTLIAVYDGYNAEPTAEGVGLATTRTVVASAVLVLILDYFLTAAFL